MQGNMKSKVKSNIRALGETDEHTMCDVGASIATYPC